MVSQNHQLRQRNSKFHSRARCIFPFQTSTSFHLQFCSPVEKRPNWSEKFAIVCNQRPVWKIPTWRKWKYQTYSNCSEFPLIKNGMGLQKIQHCSGKHFWGKYKIYISIKIVQYIFFKNTEEHFFGKRDIYFFVGKYPSISSLVSPSRLAKCLELHQDQEPIFFFCGKYQKLDLILKHQTNFC